MQARDFQALVEQFSDLTDGQRRALIEAVESKASADTAVALIEARFNAAPRCPHSINRLQSMRRKRPA